MARDVLDEHRLRRLIDVGRGLAAQLDLEAVLREVVEVARELTGARYAALGVLDDDRRELERFIFTGIDAETRTRIGDLPHGRGVLGELILNPVPLRLRDVSEHPHSYGFPAGHPPMRSFLGVPILVRGQAYGNLYLTEKEGGEFDAADEEAATILAEWAAVAIFNVRVYSQSEEERSALERAVHGLEATTEIARAVGGETDRARVLETIARRARALTGARSLLILLHDGPRCEVAAAAGECGEGPVGQAIAIESETPAGALSAAREIELEAEAALFAPLTFRGRALGAIVALDRAERGPGFQPEDERLLSAAAVSAAIAVATVQSVSEERLRQTIETAERERARWARELHDSILQGLASRRVLLSTALKNGESSRLAGAAEEAIGDITRDIEELRALITDLRPAALDQLGLVAALRDLGERIGHVTDLELATELEISEERIDPELETVLYRLAQEAINNVAKHAGVSRATLRVRRLNGGIELRVADEGRGFDPAAASDGFGLLGMRERVALAGGELRVESEPGAGSRLTAWLPLGSGLEQPAGERALDQLGTG